jgi:hypothetical protein
VKKKSNRLTIDDLPPHLRQQALQQLSRDNSANSASNVEQASGHARGKEKQIGSDDSLCRIYIHNLRHKLADSDGVSGKACLDGIVEAGLLSDDSTEEVEWVRQTQEKIPKDEDEITIVRIDVYE